MRTTPSRKRGFASVGRAQTPSRTWADGFTTVVARVPGHAALAQIAAGRVHPCGRARADRERENRTDPEHDALLADSVGFALLTVLETLAPAERVAFVLHDMFDLPFDEIAQIVERTPTAARQLASRARRRGQGVGAVPDTDRTRQQEIVTAFLAALRGGHFDALLAPLDPNVVLRADTTAVTAGASEEVGGAEAVAKTLPGRALFAQTALVDGAAGAVWAPGGQPRVVFAFTIADGRIVAIDLFADRERLDGLDLTILDE